MRGENYKKDIDDLEEKREIGPLAFFQSEGSWRPLALHECMIKQYHLSKIVTVKPTTKKFKRVSQEETDDLFLKEVLKMSINPDIITYTLRLLVNCMLLNLVYAI